MFNYNYGTFCNIGKCFTINVDTCLMLCNNYNYYYYYKAKLQSNYHHQHINSVFLQTKSSSYRLANSVKAPIVYTQKS